MEMFLLSIRDLADLFGFFAGAFFLTMALTPVLTHFLYKYKLWKKPRAQAITGEKAVVYNALHKDKHSRKVPTMAGVLIWLCVGIITLLFNFSRGQTLLPLFTLLSFGALGLLDDMINLRGKSQVAGMSFRWKFFWLLLLSILGGLWFYYKLDWTIIHIPAGNWFGLPYTIDLGWWYIVLFVLVIVATANAVNITDGLDGLAGGLLTYSFGAYTLVALLSGKMELAIFCATISGATLAYTWFNIGPARFFMGDTGALALGATLGVVAMLTNTALILPIIGFVFVVETLSVILQILSKKIRGKKLFMVSPLHHHLEALGWGESKVVMRLWVVGLVFAVIGLFMALVGRG
ncbi:MAG: phospho-N-acetylmuramoyl-pentapeptide transferase [Candidatus Berkelbacteria bacterium Licking1014_7]|uniref:Phospho-N-acetylmuramoyl-pentapeptide-transferase n=1 Tax=Candidatus Berkelbacteria bacterium Licking1014_7 TaxID=2017147 RepID=A0A554LJM8_9BACT|nr:MAG: phospho-N-acetylmuramoyl-pentapeptide transferase [Candidatus Berkelbacteria bacterium Licking1014_7]